MRKPRDKFYTDERTTASEKHARMLSIHTLAKSRPSLTCFQVVGVDGLLELFHPGQVRVLLGYMLHNGKCELQELALQNDQRELSGKRSKANS